MAGQSAATAPERVVWFIRDLATLHSRELEKVQMRWDGHTVPEAVNIMHTFEGCHLKVYHNRGVSNGYVIQAYHDPIGLPTQGWGRLLSNKKWANLSQWEEIDQETADRWFQEDLLRFENFVRQYVNVELHPLSFGALVSFVYNVGPANFELSTLRRVINREEWDEVPRQFARWKFAGGKVLNGLIRRRAAESELFMQGVEAA